MNTKCVTAFFRGVGFMAFLMLLAVLLFSFVMLLTYLLVYFLSIDGELAMLISVTFTIMCSCGLVEASHSGCFDEGEH